MLTFTEKDDTYTFTKQETEIAFGAYGADGFELFVDNDVQTFANAMQAFCYLRSKHEPRFPVSQQTIDLITKPAPLAQSMRRFSQHIALKDLEYDFEPQMG